jgi:hypothetical protein
MEIKEGDRIRLINMPDDPNPIEPETTGTVLSVTSWLRPPSKVLAMKWDNGRTLSLITPPDEYEVIKENKT